MSPLLRAILSVSLVTLFVPQSSFAQSEDASRKNWSTATAETKTKSAFDWSSAAQDLSLNKKDIPPKEMRNVPQYDITHIQDFVPVDDISLSRPYYPGSTDDTMPAPKAAPVAPVSKGAPLNLNEVVASKTASPQLTQENNLDQVIILLDGVVAPRHAYFYVADQLGLFAQSNLDVKMIAGADTATTIKLLRNSQVQYALLSGTETASLLQKAEPISIIGTIISTPLPSLATFGNKAPRSIYEFKGKTIGLFANDDSTEKMLKTMLEIAGLSTKDVTIVRGKGSALTALSSKKYDAVMVDDRIKFLATARLNNKTISYLHPEQAGVAVTDGLVLISRTDTVGKPITGKLLQALEIASQFSVNNPEEAFSLMTDKVEPLKNKQMQYQWQEAQRRLSRSPSSFSQYRLQSAHNLNKVTPLN